MTNSIEISQRFAAKIAGVGLLFMTLFAIFAEAFVRQKLIVPGDTTLTVINILANTSLFRLGIGSFIMVAILDVVVAWALYILLAPVNKSLSLLAAVFRMVYAAIFAVSLVNYFNVLQLLNSTDKLGALEPNQMQALVMLHLNAFSSGWNIGLLFFWNSFECRRVFNL